MMRCGLASDGADGFLNRRPTVSIVTIENASSIPSAIIGMPTMYSDIVPTTRRCKVGACIGIQASTAAAICLSWGSPPAIIKHRPVTKRPNAINLGSMANLIVGPPTTCRH